MIMTLTELFAASWNFSRRHQFSNRSDPNTLQGPMHRPNAGPQ